MVKMTIEEIDKLWTALYDRMDPSGHISDSDVVFIDQCSVNDPKVFGEVLGKVEEHFMDLLPE